MQTAPPPRANFSETVNQWIIYDSYVAYEAAKEAAEEKEQKKEMKEVKVRIELHPHHFFYRNGIGLNAWTRPHCSAQICLISKDFKIIPNSVRTFIQRLCNQRVG